MIRLKLATRPLAMSSCLRSDHQPEIALPVLPLYSHNTFYSVCSFFQVSHIFLEMIKHIAKKDFPWPWPLQNMRHSNTFGFTTDPRDKLKAFLPIYWDFISAVVVVIPCPL